MGRVRGLKGQKGATSTLSAASWARAISARWIATNRFLVGGSVSDRVAEDRQPLLGFLGDQAVLAAEVAIEGPFAHTGGRGDLSLAEAARAKLGTGTDSH
jgi:hypothetical protein